MYNLNNSSLSRATARMYMRSSARNRQSGASLMELMVGITIGLLVVLAAIGSLVFTRVSSTTMVDATRLQQKADAAFRLINFQTLQAGAVELNPTVDPATVAFSMDYAGFDPTVTGLPSTVSVHGVDGNGTTTQDVLRISYEDNVSVRDCLGQRSAMPAGVDNVFTYMPITGGGGNITCLGAAVGATAQPILDGVEDFQVLYGIRTVNAGVAGFQFYNAAQINGLANIADDATGISGPVNPWTRVNTINICLQLRGDTRGNPRPGWTTANAIPPCGTVLDTNDGFLRRVYSRTFSIRNALL